MLAHPQGGELAQRPHLAEGDRLQRMAEPVPLRHFTSQKTSVTPFSPASAATMSIPKPASPIPLQHPHPLPLQLSTGQLLTAYAQLLLRRGPRHRPPPLRSMRTPVKIVRAYQICGNRAVMSCGNYPRYRPQRAAISVAPAGNDQQRDQVPAQRTRQPNRLLLPRRWRPRLG
jgi:hypothetical protein